MKRPVPKSLSLAAYIVVAILVGCLALNALWLVIGSANWILLTLAVVVILAIAFTFIDKAFGDKLPFLHRLPTPDANAKIRHYLGVIALREYSPKSARTPKQIVISVLAVPLTMLLIAAALYAVSLFRPLSEFGETFVGTLLWTSLGMSLVSLVLHGLAFRLRVKYDLRSALLAIAIYLPVSILAIMAWILIMPLAYDGDSLRVSWFTVYMALFFGALICVTSALLYRVDIDPEPAPNFATHPSYRRAEIVISVSSIAVIAILLLLAS